MSKKEGLAIGRMRAGHLIGKILAAPLVVHSAAIWAL